MLLRSLATSSVLELSSITDVHTIFSNLNVNRAETSRTTVNRLLWAVRHVQCVYHTAPIGFVFLTCPARDPELAIWGTFCNCRNCFACCLCISCWSVFFFLPVNCAQHCNTTGEEKWVSCTYVRRVINSTDLLKENWNFNSDFHHE